MFKRKQKEQSRRAVSVNSSSKPKPNYYRGSEPSDLNSLRARQQTGQKLKFWKRLRLLPTLIAFGAILLSVAYSTTLSTSPSVVISGNDSIYHSAAEYKDGIMKILNSSIMNRSKLTINSINTEKAIADEFPELDSVKLGLPIVGRRPTITLQVRQPVLILNTKLNSFVLDSKGVAISETSRLISSVTSKLLTVQDQSGLVVNIGKQALTSETVSFIANMQLQLVAKQLTITGLTIPSGGNEIDVRIKDLNYYLKTDSSGDARLQIGDFLATRESGVSPAEYMDVRIEEKVFYK